MHANDTDQEQVLVRIFIGEGDKFRHVPLYEALVELFRREGFGGATVLRGIAGFGPHNMYHSDRLKRLTSDVPVVVEVVDARSRLEAILPTVKEMIDGGMITMESVDVWHYPRKAEG
jgi:PII-like signaling protein